MQRHATRRNATRRDATRSKAKQSKARHVVCCASVAHRRHTQHRAQEEQKRREFEAKHVPWSEEEKSLLVKAIKKYPAGCHDRCGACMRQ